MRMDVTVFDFSGIYNYESFYHRDRSSLFCDMTDTKGTNCLCDDAARAYIEEYISDHNISPEGMHFIDSGNYHYMSAILSGFVKEPFSLVGLDHHPDMQPSMFGDILSCGSWVLDVIKRNPFLREVHVIGADHKLIESLDTKDREKVRFYDSKDAFTVLSQIDHPVYLSIDKDVLSENELITNWDQGQMSTGDLFEFVKRLKDQHKLLGTDICGECAPDQEGIDFDEAVRTNDVFNAGILELIKE